MLIVSLRSRSHIREVAELVSRRRTGARSCSCGRRRARRSLLAMALARLATPLGLLAGWVCGYLVYLPALAAGVVQAILVFEPVLVFVAAACLFNVDDTKGSVSFFSHFSARIQNRLLSRAGNCRILPFCVVSSVGMSPHAKRIARLEKRDSEHGLHPRNRAAADQGSA